MAVSKPMLDPNKIKQDFPVFNRTVNDHPLLYLDNAATSQRPQSVLDAVMHYYTYCNANVHRGVHTMSHEASVLYEGAHKKVAKFINAKSWKEIVFTKNTTEAINSVARGWGEKFLKKGDEIVVSAMEHHSDLVPWMMLRDRLGVELKFIDVTEEGRLKVEQLDDLLSEKTKLVCVSYASNVTGVINPVKEIIQKAKSVGALSLIDASQALPHFSVDVADLDADFLAATGHKMLGPTGIGFLYARRDILNEMDPLLGGGDMIRTVTLDEATWNDLPWKFEAGTPNVAGGIGLGAAVDYLENVGMDQIFAHEQDLLDYALKTLSSIDKMVLYGPMSTENRLCVLPFNIEGVHPHDVAHILDSKGIAVRSGDHCAQPYMAKMNMDFTARASFYLYNSREDVDTLAEAIEKVKTVFKV